MVSLFVGQKLFLLPYMHVNNITIGNSIIIILYMQKNPLRMHRTPAARENMLRLPNWPLTRARPVTL